MRLSFEVPPSLRRHIHFCDYISPPKNKRKAQRNKFPKNYLVFLRTPVNPPEGGKKINN